MKVTLLFVSLLFTQFARCQISDHFNGSFESSFGIGIGIECDTFSQKLNDINYHETRWIHTDGLIVTQNVTVIDSVIYFMYSFSDSAYFLPCYSLKTDIKPNDTFYVNHNDTLLRLKLGETLDSVTFGRKKFQNVYILKGICETGHIIEIYINRKFGWLAISQNKEIWYWRQTTDR